MIKSESILKLMPALVKAQSEMEAATKSANNPYFKSKYADLNSVIGVSIPVLNKHNVAVLQPTVVIDGKKYVQTMLIHESGEYMGCLTEILCFKENDAQQQGSGITYARRYGLQSLLSIGAEDDDGNTATEKHLGQKPPVENKIENKPALSQEKPKSVKTTTFSLPSPERKKDLKYIKDALGAFPKETRKEMSKQLTGVDSWEEVLFLPDESIKDICKLITLKYAQE